MEAPYRLCPRPEAEWSGGADPAGWCWAADEQQKTLVGQLAVLLDLPGRTRALRFRKFRPTWIPGMSRTPGQHETGHFLFYSLFLHKLLSIYILFFLKGQQ